MTFTTFGAIFGLAVSIFLIIWKFHPVYSLVLGALIGGIIGGGGLVPDTDLAQPGLPSAALSLDQSVGTGHHLVPGGVVGGLGPGGIGIGLSPALHRGKDLNAGPVIVRRSPLCGDSGGGGAGDAFDLIEEPLHVGGRDRIREHVRFAVASLLDLQDKIGHAQAGQGIEGAVGLVHRDVGVLIAVPDVDIDARIRNGLHVALISPGGVDGSAGVDENGRAASSSGWTEASS